MIKVKVGEMIVCRFKNQLSTESASIHWHGIELDNDSDGTPVSQDAVLPGQSYTYQFDTSRPGIFWFHPHMLPGNTLFGGMYGVISILGRHERAPDREFQVFFAPVGEFQGIDGRAFVGNTPVFHSRVGDLVQWDVLALGSDHHTFHVHGHRWHGAGPSHRHQDVQELGPADSFRIRWREDAPGTWLYHCHVEDHMERGMIGVYQVAAR